MLGDGILDSMDLYSLQSILDIQDNDPDIYYINHTKFAQQYWHTIDGCVRVNDAFLESLKKYRLVVIDTSGEHWGDPKHNLTTTIQENLESAGIKKFLIITHLLEDHKRTLDIVFCPSEYHTSRKFIKSSQIDSILAKIQLLKSYPISCLNNYAWPHRIYYCTQIYKKSWFEKILYTINPDDQTNNLRNDAIILDSDTITEWDSIKSNFQKRFKGSIWDLDNPAYEDSYVNIVTETTVWSGVYLSEKTWKAVASGMWFLILGCPGTIRHLRTLGVDVFDDIFDHSYYDNEPDFFKRVDKLNQIVNDFMQKDHALLWRNTADRRRNNILRFCDGSFDRTYLQEIKDQISVVREN